MYLKESLKKNISITVDTDILNTLRILAMENDRSLSQYINRVLRFHVTHIHKQHKSKL